MKDERKTKTKTNREPTYEKTLKHKNNAYTTNKRQHRFFLRNPNKKQTNARTHTHTHPRG